MLKIQVRSNEKNFFIPVPYGILSIGTTVLSSDYLNKRINEVANRSKKDEDVPIVVPKFDKKELRRIIKVLKQYRGMEIVHIKEKNGSEISIHL